MKHTVSLIAALSLLAASAFAQTYNAPQERFVLNGTTANVAAATTNTYNLTATTNQIDVRYQQNVGIQFSVKGSGAGTDVMYALLARCVGNPANSNNWDTIHIHRIPVTQAGTGVVTTVTNIACVGEGWLGLMAVENVSASRYMTNMVLRSADKHL